MSLEDDLGITDDEQKLKLQQQLEQDLLTNPDADIEVQYIKEASYTREEVITLCQEDLNWLAGTVMPETFSIFFPSLMITIWQLMRQLVEFTYGDNPKLALGIPRGFGKTTLVKLFIVYIVLFTKRKFILITASTATMAENILADVWDMLRSPNVISIFGDCSVAADTDRNDLKKFGFRNRNIIIAAIGAGGSLRGLNLKNSRPDVMIFEDIQTRECADSPLQSQTLERWMLGTAMKAKAPSGCFFIFCGNMYPTDNSILKKLKSNSHWTKFISGSILENGESLWPELRSIESLIQELDNDIESGHPEIFFSEVMNDTEAGINTNVDFSKITPWPFRPDEKPQGKFIIIDPSGDKLTSDLVAIGYFEVYDEIPGLREVLEDKLSPGNTIRQALLLALRTGTKLIVIEAVAYQASLLYWFEETCRALGIEGITCVEIHPGGASKNYRIINMLKEITSGELLLHPAVKTRVTHQISNWNAMKRNNVDNILDLLAYARKAVIEYSPIMSTAFDLDMIGEQSIEVIEHNTPF